MQVNIERMKATLLALAKIGFNEEDKGIYRVGFSAADMEARRWLTDLLAREGFEPRMDGAGNVYGRYGPADKATVTVGSHLDTVPAGGMFDGALGVVAALVILRVCREEELAQTGALGLLATGEEEGRYGGMLGAQAIAGDLTPGLMLRMHDADGNRLADAMAAAGL